MEKIRRILWEEVAPHHEFHAALLSLQTSRGEKVAVHTHDFHEMFLVLDGDATHLLNGSPTPLRPRELFLIRPHDSHAFIVRPGKRVQFINIAFRSSVWWQWLSMVGLENCAAGWEKQADPQTTRLGVQHFTVAEAAFTDLLHVFHRSDIGSLGPDTTPRLELCRFWTNIVSALLAHDRPSPTSESTTEFTSGAFRDYPLWLARTCCAMLPGDNLRAGVPCMVELSGVSPSHLSRTLKACSGLAPTDWVNARRIGITDIAFECGFSNISYFYRLFLRRYGASPRSYRRAMQRAVVPQPAEDAAQSAR
jgi:AraC family cel operon transcriptional repressor